MVRYAFGFDPSINDCAWAVVGTDGSVYCGLIRNKYKEDTRKLDSWQKLESMLELLQEHLDTVLLEILSDNGNYQPLVVWVCEGQYATRRGNQEHNIRLGWLSSMAYTHGPRSSLVRMIAVPSKWTRGVPKEVRHPELLARLQSESKWRWEGDIAPPSLMHNIYDAIGLAQWGLDNIELD